jgi:hypothetical protein
MPVLMPNAFARRFADKTKPSLRRPPATINGYAVNAVVLATGKVELDDVVQVFLTAPKTPEQAADLIWRRDSTCHKMLVRAKQRHGDNTVKMTEQYFLQKWPNTPPDVRGSAQFTCDVITDLCQSEPLHRLFFSRTDFTPEILTDGAVLIVDAPALAAGVQGRVINGMMRLAVERMIQKRNDSNQNRPVAIIWDEFQTSITKADCEFAAVARSPRCALVMASQNVNAIGDKMGPEASRALYGNLRTKLFFANDDPDTNEFMADVAGKWAAEKTTKTKGSKGESSTATHKEDVYAVPPSAALTLESGGAEFQGKVTGIMVHGGHKLTKGQPWMKVKFNQNAPVWNWGKIVTGSTGAIGWRRPAPDFRWLR